MSFILDALRKSEQARTKTLSQSLAQQTVPVAGRSRVPWGLLLGGLLLLNALLVLGLWWPASPPAPTTPPVTKASPAGTPAVRSLASEAASSSLPPALDASPPVEPATAPASAGTLPALPFAALPEDVQAALSPLTLNMHAYADSAAQRLVVINLAPYHEGDVLRAGLTVREITPDGVILDYQGTRFFLSRP